MLNCLCGNCYFMATANANQSKTAQHRAALAARERRVSYSVTTSQSSANTSDTEGTHESALPSGLIISI